VATNAKLRCIQVIAAVALTAAIVLPVAAAAAGGAPQHPGHGGKDLHTGKRGKKTPQPKGAAGRLAALSAEAESLTRRVAAVKAADAALAAAPKVTTVPAVQQSVEPASGPAGGDLVGTYPAPRLAPHSVGGEAIQDDSVGAAQLAPGTLRREDFAPGSIGSAKIADRTISAAQIDGYVFDSEKLAETFRWPPQTHGPNLSATLQPGGHSARVVSTCPNETRLISGGFVWKDLGGRGAEILNSSPVAGIEAFNSWEVVAKVKSGGTENTITPVALCLE
jgi:hypothetical protein